MPTFKDLEQVGRDWCAGKISKFGAMRKLRRKLMVSAYTIRQILWAHEDPITHEKGIGYSDCTPNTGCPVCGRRSDGECRNCRQLQQQEQQQFYPGVAREGASRG